MEKTLYLPGRFVIRAHSEVEVLKKIIPKTIPETDKPRQSRTLDSVAGFRTLEGAWLYQFLGHWDDSSSQVSMSFLICQQLVLEALERILKAILINADNTAKNPGHKLHKIFKKLEKTEDYCQVDSLTQRAIKISSSGPLPYGAVNMVAAYDMSNNLEGNYKNMSSYEYFYTINEAWNATATQYLGFDNRFNNVTGFSVNSRIVAGSIQLAEWLLEYAKYRIETTLSERENLPK